MKKAHVFFYDLENATVAAMDGQRDYMETIDLVSGHRARDRHEQFPRICRSRQRFELDAVAIVIALASLAGCQ